jgi:putative chitinase
MKILEIISEDLDEGKKKRKKFRWAAYGPGPYGLYGVNTGYSGDGGAGDGGVGENFADGKVKGKSRPGRVKRSGASCNGSVTSLRARAKAASGEKAKMYHWCANMKSGRKKADEAYGVVPGDPIGDAIKQAQAKKQQPVPTQQPAPVKKPAAPAKKPAAPVQPQPITGTTLENVLRDIAIRAGILGNELAQFLAQCAHETANFSTLSEFGDAKTFAKYDPRYNPEKAKQLGNTQPGDGERFKGRGYLQITGRYNYAQIGQALGIPLEQKPQMLEDPAIAAKASIWFWNNRVKPKVGNFADTKSVTSVINPALRGLQQRHGNFKDYVSTTSIPPSFAVKESRVSSEDYHPNDMPPGPEFKPTMPKGTVRVDVSDVYDWYKLGQHISNLKGLGKHDFGKGPPSTIFSFGSEDEEHKYIKDLEKTGLTTTDIDPVDPKQPKGMKRQKVDPTYNVGETMDDKRDIKLIAKHYFPVDDEHIIEKYKMKKDRNGYYLPQWNTSGRVFDANFTSLNRLYGRPHTIK